MKKLLLGLLWVGATGASVAVLKWYASSEMQMAVLAIGAFCAW